LNQEFSHQRELLGRERGLSSPIFRPVIIRLRVRNPSLLRFLQDFGLALGCRCHEPNQGVTHGLLHRVGSCPIEGQPVDDGLDANLAANELANGIGHVGIIAPKPVNPTNHQRVAFPKNVEQPFPLGSLTKTGGDA
jgi:hypothetical protein